MNYCKTKVAAIAIGAIVAVRVIQMDNRRFWNRLR